MVTELHPAGLHAFESRRPDRVATYSDEQPEGAEFDEQQLAPAGRFRR